ncbi:MAG: hypothetical protein H0Z24_00560 [Thermosipho sp. (in: Bacteria)]|nr:hypothetical protein [Thermosipho sp. (in: thermotogales)]
MVAIFGILLSVIFAIYFTIKGKNIFEKLIPLLSISTKISLLIIVFSFVYDLPFMFELGIFYLLISIGGAFIISSFISRSDFYD